MGERYLKLIQKVALAGVVSGCLLSCGGRVSSTNGAGADITPDDSAPSAPAILPLGASRVEGYRPQFESYRYELWKDLVEAGLTFDFIGTRADQAAYPTFLEQEFDRDNEGWGGYTSGNLLEGLPGWLEAAGTPDIVLFSSPGGNDLLMNMPFDDAVANVTGMIDVLQEANPEVTILIEQFAPGRSDSEIWSADMEDRWREMNATVVELAETKSTDMSQVVVVDMATGFQDDFLADDVHYNEEGAAFVAERYFEALSELLE